MGRMLFNTLMITTSFILCAPLGFSHEQVAATTDTLLENSKIRQGEMLLKDFADGKSTTQVIVNLSRPRDFANIVEGGWRKWILKDAGLRRDLEEAIRVVQTKVIGRMDPNKVRVKEIFRYVSGFSAEVTLEGLQELAQSEEVITIDKDQILQAHLAQGIPLINASTVRNSYSGAGIGIAICDTGIDYTHPKLGGGGFPNNKVVGGCDTGDDDDDPIDVHGHGTCCSGIAAGDIGATGAYIGGVAYSAKLYALKISFADEGWALASDLIEAWEWCIAHQNDDPSNPIMIISTSFGGGQYSTVCNSISLAMTEAAANAVAAGMTLFASSGNDGYCDAISWPACISHVVSVGAVYDSGFGIFSSCVSPDSCATKYSTNQCETGYYAVDSTAADSVPSYSNVATFMDLLAPSNRVYTTDITGSHGYSHGDYYTSFGGTSGSCPYAAGAAACLQSAAQSVTGSYLTPGEVKSNLASTGDLITDEKVSITKPRINLGSVVDAVDWTSLCECDMVPDTTDPIPLGGTFGFDATVTNNTDLTGTVYFVTFLTPPPPYERYPASGWVDFYELLMTPQETKSGHVSHTIPATWPLGTYTYHGWVGRPGPVIYDECQFEFHVTETP